MMNRSAIALLIAAAFGLPGAVAEAQSSQGKRSSETVESRRSEAQQQTQSTLDREAVAAINETENALKAIKSKDKKEALAALERATGKVNILVARNPKAALIPVEFGVEVADTAPSEPKAIGAIADASRDALKDRKFADARALLDMLRSEVRVRTFNLPLASYPLALAKAAKLVDDGKNDEAASVLRTALNTLVIVDRATAIPMLELTDALKSAEEAAKSTDDKANGPKLDVAKAALKRGEALGHLIVAKAALKRGEALGQIDDESVKDFDKRIDELTKKLKGKESKVSTFFQQLLERVSALSKRQSGSESKGTSPRS